MKGWLIEQAFRLITPILVGALTPPAMRAIKALEARVDALPATVQQSAVLVLAGLGNAVATFLHVQVTGDVTAWSHAEVNTVLSAAVAYSFHASRKAKDASVEARATRAEVLRQ